MCDEGGGIRVGGKEVGKGRSTFFKTKTTETPRKKGKRNEKKKKTLCCQHATGKDVRCAYVGRLSSRFSRVGVCVTVCENVCVRDSVCVRGSRSKTNQSKGNWRKG